MRTVYSAAADLGKAAEALHGLIELAEMTGRSGLTRTYVVFPSLIMGLTCGDAPDRGCGFWLRESDRDG